jgi:hypothetical protein
MPGIVDNYMGRILAENNPKAILARMREEPNHVDTFDPEALLLWVERFRPDIHASMVKTVRNGEPAFVSLLAIAFGAGRSYERNLFPKVAP